MSRHDQVHLQPIDPSGAGTVPSASPQGRFLRTMADALGLVQRGLYAWADDLDDAADTATRPAPVDAELIEVAEAVRRLGIPESTVRRLCRAGQLPTVRLGSRWRVNWSALQAASARREASR